MLRILHLVSYPLYSGPVPSTLRLAMAQRALGHTVWVACDALRGNFDGFEEDARPYLSDARLWPPVPLTLCAKGALGQVALDASRLRRLVRDFGVDVVHSHQSHDHALCQVLPRGRSCRVRTVHASRALAGGLGRRWLLKQCDGVIVRCMHHLHQHAQVAGHSPAICIAAAADDTFFTPVPPTDAQGFRKAFNVPPKAPLVIHAALMARRGQEELLHAAASLQHLQLHVLLVGSGDQLAALQALAADLGLSARVHFTGYLQKERLRIAYAAADAVFVGQAGNDASVRGVTEAMAVGSPVVAVARDALAEAVTAARGYPVKACQPAAIAAGLAQCLSDPTEAARRVETAARWVEIERSAEKEALATLGFYRAVAPAKSLITAPG